MTFAPVVEDTVVPELCSEYDELTGDSGKVAGELTVVGGKVAGELTVVGGKVAGELTVVGGKVAGELTVVGGKVAGELTVVGGKVAGELTVVGGKVDGDAVEGPAIKSISLKLGHCNPERYTGFTERNELSEKSRSEGTTVEEITMTNSLRLK